MKILNLYACLGGNRYLWGVDHEIVAVELDPELARLYQERFPNDKVIISDAHQYLLDHYKEFDFIWSSPPCPSHSKARFARRESTIPEYPDMAIYQQVIFLNHWFNGKYVVENVVPYYKPLIIGQKRGRHIYWTNFKLPSDLNERNESKGFMSSSLNEVNSWCKFHDYDFTKYKGNQRIDKIARNLVDYVAGKAILDCAIGCYEQNNLQQTNLF